MKRKEKGRIRKKERMGRGDEGILKGGMTGGVTLLNENYRCDTTKKIFYFLFLIKMEKTRDIYMSFRVLLALLGLMEGFREEEEGKGKRRRKKVVFLSTSKNGMSKVLFRRMFF